LFIILVSTISKSYIYEHVSNRDKGIDTQRGFDDFICLGACREIITSQVSSFSDEAKRINDINIKLIEELK